MSQEYAESRIKEALKLAKGNQAKARQQVITWAMQDERLLQALTKSHLSGIVAYNIDRVASGRAEAAKHPAALAETKTTKAKKEPVFGMELLKAVASSSADVFGLEHNAPLGRRGQASQEHIDAIQAIVSKKKKRP